MSFRRLALRGVVAAAIAAAAFAALAQGSRPMTGGTMPMGHGGMAMDEYMGAMNRMQMGMKMQSSGDADVDFARMMIPHHQAAIDMAKSELKYGKDPEVRKLAEDIIVAQEKEIAQMKAWLEKNKK